MVQPCQSCGRPSKRKCSGCQSLTAWYCSPACQRSHWVVHIFHCNPRRSITTADHLALAVHTVRIPEDLQTLTDYGFNRIFSIDDQHKMLGLYICLIRILHISPKTIHLWRINGTLLEETIAAFETAPAGPRNTGGRNYPWFLENQYILDHSLEPPGDRTGENLWPLFEQAGIPKHSTDAERDAITSTWLENKRYCFMFCAQLISRFNPPHYDEAWIDFGYCACLDITAEMKLSEVYEELLERCTFNEFWAAFDSFSLIDLLDAQGLERQRREYRHLEEVLKVPSKGLKSVWRLKQIVKTTEVDMIPSVQIDYGFANCKTQEEFTDLTEVYKVYFWEKKADPITLHDAAMQGRLFRHVRDTVKLSKRFKRLMRTPYPLANNELIQFVSEPKNPASVIYSYRPVV